MPIAAPLRAGTSMLAALLFAAGHAWAAPAMSETSSPTQATPGDAGDAQATSPDNDTEHDAGDPENYPAQSLSPQFLLNALLGDIATQRGQAKLGANTWLELSKKNPDPRVAQRALEIAYRGGFAQIALAAANRWLELEPDSVNAQQSRLAILIHTGDLESTQKQMIALFKQQKDHAGQMFLDLHTVWTSKIDKSAILALVGELVKQHQDIPEAHFALATAARQANDLRIARTSLEQALRLKPDWPAAILIRAELMEGESPDSAIQYLRESLERLPTAHDLRYALARLLSNQNKFAEAQNHFAVLSEANPKVLEYMLGEALSAIEAHNYPQAQAALERALATQPKETGGLHYYLGLVADEQWQFTKARDHYALVENEAYRRQAQMRLARIHAKLGDETNAISIVHQISASTPAESIAKIQLEAQVWRELKQFDRSKATINQGLIQFADEPDLIYDRALLHEATGDIPSAEADLRKILAQRPDNPMALNALGYTLANHTNRFDEAEALLKQAMSHDADNPVMIDSYGWLQYRKGHIEEAIKWLEKAFRALPDPEVAAHYGEALWKAGKKDEARKVWEHGRKLDPNHPVLIETIARVTTK